MVKFQNALIVSRISNHSRTRTEAKMSNENNNNASSQSNKNPEPTLNDIINLIGNIPNKLDFSEMQERLVNLTNENSNKIASVEQKVESVSSNVTTNSDKIAGLESTIQALHQDKLRNNVCISGVPIDENTDTNDTVIKIASSLQVIIKSILRHTQQQTTNSSSWPPITMCTNKPFSTRSELKKA